MKIGFAVIPNESLIDTLISFQVEMNSTIALEPKLGHTYNLPHITLIQGDFKDSLKYIDVLYDLQDYLVGSMIETLVASVQEIFYQPVGWYFVRIQKEPWLIHLHNHLFDIVKDDMLPGVVNPDKERWFTPLETQNTRKYGYRYIGEAYLPHITLGRNPDLTKSKLIFEMNRRWERANIASPQLMSRLTVYEMGENGAHAQTLASLFI
ncbi:hypothetical protein NZD89_12555 [Alicyclobacillus fastidiosus]|uniref:2'-5' RNA ligase family protein n=1 Tax=Alicyclobacillus fastidiosus TaxID=392011 RepID=A0ABY6ZMQ4_9BACL|nr:hypothetical protein [Alicyclobacillus fastidiosus]WAH44132.1 hypothetical protein NZD89_12555 [Alicyclobacillus fastidiosus]GMA60434.1 hypothetical protein GCM10025859_08740 [Alicyclobacillus fastidiosus]